MFTISQMVLLSIFVLTTMFFVWSMFKSLSRLINSEETMKTESKIKVTLKEIQSPSRDDYSRSRKNYTQTYVFVCDEEISNSSYIRIPMELLDTSIEWVPGRKYTFTINPIQNS